MPRVVVYAADLPPPPAPPAEELLQPKSAGTPRKKRPMPEAPAPDGKTADGYTDKFLKYIPAETIAFYAPLAALDGLGVNGRWILLGLGFVVSILYLVARAKREKLAPPLAFYALAGLAYVCWAFGTSDFLAVVGGVDAVWSKVVLAAGVFLVPGIDEALLK